MWQRFTERARKVVFYAQEEAGQLGENYVATEHLLLGLVREKDCMAGRVIDELGISFGRIRSEVMRQVTRGPGRLGQDMQLTPRAKRVIDLAYDEARQLKNDYIGSEHLLLGLTREGEGLAARVLTKLGADLERTREEVVRLQGNGDGPSPSEAQHSLSGDFWRRMTDDLRKVALGVMSDPRSVSNHSDVARVFLEKLLTDGPNAATARFERTGLDHVAIGTTLLAVADREKRSALPIAFPNVAVATLGIVHCAFGHAVAFGFDAADTDHAVIASLIELERQKDPIVDLLQAHGLTSGRLIASPRLKPAGEPFDLPETIEVAAKPSAAAGPAPAEVNVLATRVIAMQAAALKLLTDSSDAAKKLERLLKCTSADSNLSDSARNVLSVAAEEAARDGEPAVLPKHLLLALLKAGGSIVSLLFETLGLDATLAAGMFNELKSQIADEGEGEDKEEGESEQEAE